MSINDGQWHHVCVTWTSSTGQWRAWKDGTAESDDNEVKPVTMDAVPGDEIFFFKITAEILARSLASIHCQ